MNQLPDDILKILNDHERRLNDMERAPRSTTIITTGRSTVWLGQLQKGLPAICTFVLAEGGWGAPTNIAGWPRWSIAKNVTDFNTISGANIFPNGPNWSSQNIEDLDIIPNMTMDGQSMLNNRQEFQLILKNRSSTPIPQVGITLEWKLPQLTGIVL